MDSVSVVIPCFNLGDFLPETVASVQRQTLRPAELFIVDDGSDDPATLELLGLLCGQGISVLRQPNRGVAAARNLGINHARGQFILCLDADDVLMPTFLEKTVAKLKGLPEVGIVTTHVEFFGERGGTWHTPDYDPVSLLWQNCIASASLFRKACWQEVGGYADLAANEDWDFWLSIVERGWRWAVVPAPLYRYRNRKGSRSEHEKAKRAGLLREIIGRHSAMYAAYFPDVLVAMDGELCRVKRALRKHDEDALESMSGPEETGLLELRARSSVLESQVRRLHREIARRVLAQRIRAIAEQVLPPDAKVLVVSKGDEDLVNLGCCHAAHFPQANSGEYAGFHLADSATAIAHLESLRAQGADFLLIPATSLWWLDHYREFRHYLEGSRILFEDKGTCIIYALRESAVPPPYREESPIPLPDQLVAEVGR